MTSRSIQDLDIIGFASVLEKPTLPRVLAPVFEVRASPGVVLLPPLIISGEEVFNFTVSNHEEMKIFVNRGSLSRLPQHIPAQMNHDLWVNDEGQVAYEPKRVVKKVFERLFAHHLNLAKQKLSEEDPAAARQHATVARAVNPNHLDPLVIRAKAELRMGDLQGFAFTSHIAADMILPTEFDQLVNGQQRDRAGDTVHGMDSMRGMAALKSQRVYFAKSRDIAA